MENEVSYLSHLLQHQYVLVHVLHLILILKVIVTIIIYMIMMIIITIIGLSAPLSAGITAVVTIPVSSVISSLFTLFVVYLCCGKGNYSMNTTNPVYDTPLPGISFTRTSEFEMKGNQAYDHVTSGPRSTSEYETVTF